MSERREMTDEEIGVALNCDFIVQLGLNYDPASIEWAKNHRRPKMRVREEREKIHKTKRENGI